MTHLRQRSGCGRCRRCIPPPASSSWPSGRRSVYFAGLVGYDQRAMTTPTLAAKLGTTTHFSALLQKTRRLGLGPADLEILAIQRGVVTTRQALNRRCCWPTTTNCPMRNLPSRSSQRHYPMLLISFPVVRRWWHRRVTIQGARGDQALKKSKTEIRVWLDREFAV